MTTSKHDNIERGVRRMSGATDRPTRTSEMLCEVSSNTSHLSHFRDSTYIQDYFYTIYLGTGCFILRTITCQTKLQASGFQLV